MHPAALPPAAQLYDETLAARRVHGWAAVAPALTPYLNTTSWRSGAPLPDDLYSAVAARTRLPPWLPGPLQLLITFLLTILPGAFLCVLIYVIGVATNNSPSDWPEDDWLGDGPGDGDGGDGSEAEDRAWLYALLLFCPFLLVTCLCFCVLRQNDSVRQHVGALYLLYLQDWAASGSGSAAGGHKDLVLKFRLRRHQEYTVYSDGSYEVREMYRRRRVGEGGGMGYRVTARGGGPGAHRTHGGAGGHMHGGGPGAHRTHGGAGGHMHGGAGGHMPSGGSSGGGSVGGDGGGCASGGGGSGGDSGDSMC